MAADWRERALLQVNLYRFLADLPEVTTSSERDAKAQACALMMSANNSLNHSPPEDWTCWSEDGSQGAGSANLASTPAVTAVDLYMVDPGNPTTMGHRRWILSNSLGPTGIGSTDEYSCMWTLGGSGDAGKAWTAYPPPGEFPFGAVNPLWWGGGIDETGWTVQSDDIDLGAAEVSITVDGEARAVSVTSLASGYGSTSAITMIPDGWTTQSGTTYHVEITGISEAISYDVEVIDCD
nr:CAP domain-containing protein [Pseudenhygromyxa sp. WMMC2535]